MKRWKTKSFAARRLVAAALAVFLAAGGPPEGRAERHFGVLGQKTVVRLDLLRAAICDFRRSPFFLSNLNENLHNTVKKHR